MSKTVHLGFEVDTGKPVEIPVAHMVVTGQTQAAGKTTALEALVMRSGVRALAFRTKRGEGAFETSGARVLPYFRERADWRFVSSILEASIGERMKFERSWIMRATKGAKKLTDVRRNVRELGAKAKGGMSADMFMMLGEYLDGVIPELDRVTFASKVDLRSGGNVVDLCDLSVNVQGLVISSMLQWVHDRERGVVAVLPEAWKFIPQGRNSPVRMAAIAYAREGGTLGNLIWLDSQDLAGAEKEVVRAASVYLLGVQREANEIKRTLDHIPAGVKKPKAADLATLKLGQFFACWGDHVVRTYVQPAWLNEHEAQMVAIGKMSPEHAARAKAPLTKVVASGKFEDLDPRPLMATVQTVKMADRWPASKTHPEDDMTPAQEKKLDRLIDLLVEAQEGKTQAMAMGEPMPPELTTAAKWPTPKVDASEFEEELYHRFLARLKDEAPQVMLKLVAQRPELRVEVERPVLRIDGASLRGRISQLLANGFFKAMRDGSAVLAELARRGGSVGDRGNYARELGWLTDNGFLLREKDGWIATGQKCVVEER